jgi:hypothetical protein
MRQIFHSLARNMRIGTAGAGVVPFSTDQELHVVYTLHHAMEFDLNNVLPEMSNPFKA